MVSLKNLIMRSKTAKGALSLEENDYGLDIAMPEVAGRERLIAIDMYGGSDEEVEYRKFWWRDYPQKILLFRPETMEEANVEMVLDQQLSLVELREDAVVLGKNKFGQLVVGYPKDMFAEKVQVKSVISSRVSPGRLSVTARFEIYGSNEDLEMFVRLHEERMFAEEMLFNG